MSPPTLTQCRSGLLRGVASTLSTGMTVPSAFRRKKQILNALLDFGIASYSWVVVEIRQFPVQGVIRVFVFSLG